MGYHANGIHLGPLLSRAPHNHRSFPLFRPMHKSAFCKLPMQMSYPMTQEPCTRPIRKQIHVMSQAKTLLKRVMSRQKNP